MHSADITYGFLLSRHFPGARQCYATKAVGGLIVAEQSTLRTLAWKSMWLETGVWRGFDEGKDEKRRLYDFWLRSSHDPVYITPIYKKNITVANWVMSSFRRMLFCTWEDRDTFREKETRIAENQFRHGSTSSLSGRGLRDHVCWNEKVLK